jgi:pimeloyl-ACP methyl ester carboxylesterase
MNASLRTDVLEISYADSGPADGDPLLLLHGWPDAARGWAPIATHLNEHGFRTITPDLRGSGSTRFLAAGTPRDGHAAALVQDALDLADGLGLERFGVIGHDWGGRAAYSLAAVAPERITAIASLALAHQPHGVFSMPDFGQARAFWYQWLLYVDAGVAAVTRDPLGFARTQWDTWSPPGWFDDAEFAATAAGFANPDWVAITLNAYRARFLADEPRDLRYDALRARLAATGTLAVDTLMIQGGADYCDEPASSEGLGKWFTGGYRREVLDGVGHFPHREAPDAVAALLTEHFR